MSRRQGGNSIWARAGYGIRKYGPGVVGAAKTVNRIWNNTRPTSKPASARSTTNNTVSFQHDFQSQYRRRRAPKRVIRRAKRQANMFHYQLGKNSAQYSRVFNFIYAPATVTPTDFTNSQTTFNVGLYGGKIASSTGMNTWYDVCNDANLVASTGKVLCKSACLDVQVQNVDSANTLIVDAYKYVARREGYDEPNLEWRQALTNQLSVAGSANDLTEASLECTPFDAPGFGSKWLITGKTRYRIAPNNSVYLQMRDPRNYSFATARFDYDLGNATTRVTMFKGMTKGWIFVARSAAAVSTTSLAPINWKVIQTQSYRYAFIESTDDRQGQN